MKKIILLFVSCLWVYGLSLESAISLAINHSDNLKEQDALKKRVDMLYKSSFSAYVPSLDFGYVFSYNIPSVSRSYLLNSFNLRVNYNLFNGLKDYYTNLDSKETKKRSQYSYYTAHLDLVLQTKMAYIKALQSRALLKILEERRINIETQRHKAMQFVSQGIRSKNESLSMDITLSNTLISIQNAKLNLEYQLKVLEQLLKTTISDEELEDIKIDTNRILDREEILNEALQKNPQYLNLLSNLESAKYKEKIAMGNFLPSVDFSGVKYWYIDGGSAALTNYGLQSQVRVSVSWNIFNGLSDGYRFQASRYYTLSLQSKIQAFKRSLSTQIDEIIRQFDLAKQQYEISNNALKKAEENYKITNNRYTQGISTYTELIDAELLLNTSRTNISQSKYDMATALAQIDYLLSLD